MKTLEMLLREGTEILETAEIGEARLDAWLLLEYITGKNRAYYYAHMDQETEEGQEKAYLKLCRKRAEHIPLQHLTGTACFMGYDFFVDERVLVPRQDTEILVEEALNLLKKTEKPRILDMCTGSGCILLSILKEEDFVRLVPDSYHNYMGYQEEGTVYELPWEYECSDEKNSFLTLEQYHDIISHTEWESEKRVEPIS